MLLPMLMRLLLPIRHKTQLVLERSRFKWGAFGEQGFNFSARPRTSTSNLYLHRRFTTKAPHNINAQPNYTWNTTQLAPHVKYHDGDSSYEMSGERDGSGDRPERNLKPRRRHDTVIKKRATSLRAVGTEEGSSGIAGTGLLNPGLENLSYNLTHGTMRRNTKEMVPHSRPSKQPQSSSTTQDDQQHAHPLQSWQVQKRALLEKFGSSGWRPRKRLSPDVLEVIRALNSQSPEKYTTPVLAEQFKVSPEGIRRILKSKWRPNEQEQAKRRLRWNNRGKAIWSQMVEIGIKPPKKWRVMGVKKK